jgi:hypothetical protein
VSPSSRSGAGRVARIPPGQRLAIAAAAWVVSLGSLAGCPSLGEINVGSSLDAGMGTHPDVVAHDAHAAHDVRDAGALDVVTDEGKSCSPDLLTDRHNCGRCGHDCAGGTCMGGACQAYPLVTGNMGPVGIAVTDGKVYFTSVDGTVDMVPADGGSTLEMVNGLQFPEGITTEGPTVYWANLGYGSTDASFAGSIMGCGLLGCTGGVPTTIAPSELGGPMDVTANNLALYWTNDFNGEVRSSPLGVSDAGGTTLVKDPNYPIAGVAIDVAFVYWVETKYGGIFKCDLSGCPAPIPVASGQSAPKKVHVAGKTLYWSTSDAVMSCDPTDCKKPTVFAARQSSAEAFAHDTTHLYWTLYAPVGKVLSCPLSGCTKPTVLAADQASPYSIAVDDTAVYWANRGGGSIMRVVK